MSFVPVRSHGNKVDKFGESNSERTEPAVLNNAHRTKEMSLDRMESVECKALVHSPPSYYSMTSTSQGRKHFTENGNSPKTTLLNDDNQTEHIPETLKNNSMKKKIVSEFVDICKSHISISSSMETLFPATDSTCTTAVTSPCEEYALNFAKREIFASELSPDGDSFAASQNKTPCFVNDISKLKGEWKLQS